MKIVDHIINSNNMGWEDKIKMKRCILHQIKVRITKPIRDINLLKSLELINFRQGCIIFNCQLNSMLKFFYEMLSILELIVVPF
ncbi:unnamed protein product [Paramecium octaurelia]|uniref:Uncharacterized protein n=1 Tax=Paramecium octaurelia TaxID=43137 RepID=A0A8S1W8J3_PAROT|nr:unnamed protein product [Paramecium octaurelia]